MVFSHNSLAVENGQLLKSLLRAQKERKNFNLVVKTDTGEGFISIREGKTLRAEYGRLRGNGALMSLLAQQVSAQAVEATTHVAREISLTLQQMEQLLARLPGAAVQGGLEDQLYDEAERLFFQFRRKDAGSRLITLLKNNRFYYPGWLLHGRLMTRSKNIRKSLVEARVWGNIDAEIQQEVRRIEPSLVEGMESVKRCIFCWSPIPEGADQCNYCGGQLRPGSAEAASFPGEESLRTSLERYEKAHREDQKNTRILYCLFLGYLSLGDPETARNTLEKGLRIAPGEALFLKGLSYLKRLTSRQEEFEQPAQFSGPLPTASIAEEQSVASTGRTVLVVDDSPTARKVVSMLLERKGYTIAETETGTEALAMLDRIRPDLVLLDVVLPDMSGYEALATIRRKYDQLTVPVVMLSSKSQAIDRLKGIALGANEFLVKPFDPERLAATLAKYLPSHPAASATATPVPGQRSVVKPPAQIKRTRPEIAGHKVASPAPALKSQGVSAQEGSEKLILIVEDSPTARKVISMVLVKNGYQILEAASGQEAMACLAEKVPRLILLDAMLPDTTGYEILTKLKKQERWRDVPVVMLTAKKSAMDRQKGIQAGSVEYLTKPFDPQKLLGVIRNHISA